MAISDLSSVFLFYFMMVHLLLSGGTSSQLRKYTLGGPQGEPAVEGYGVDVPCLGHFLGGIEPFLGRPGSFWGHLGINLASVWHHFEAFLGPFWVPFGPF